MFDRLKQSSDWRPQEKTGKMSTVSRMIYLVYVARDTYYCGQPYTSVSLYFVACSLFFFTWVAGVRMHVVPLEFTTMAWRCVVVNFLFPFYAPGLLAYVCMLFLSNSVLWRDVIAMLYTRVFDTLG